MRNASIRRLVLSGLMAAITCLLTLVSYRIPGTESAYANLGDAGVYLSAFLLAGPWGALSAAVGSAIADVVLASALYAPATFVIKGAMALIAGALLKKAEGAKRVLVLFPAGIVMPVGYFLYEWLLYGIPTALISVPLNLVQMCLGIVIGGAAILATARLPLEK